MALTLVSMGALVLAPATADAQRRAPQAEEQGPSDEDRAAARDAYGRGQSAFESGDYETALAAFLEAYEAVPNPIVLVSIANSQERLGDVQAAIDTLEQYLEERADAPDREAIEQRLEDLRTRPATLVISSTPTGAAITIDGEPSDEVTPAEVEVPAGEHTIAIALEGYEESSEVVTVATGERYEHAPVLTEAVPAGDEFGEEGEGDEYEEEEEEVVEEEEEGVSAGVWVASAIAGVGLITGTVLGFLALSEQSEFDDMPATDVADRGETYALFADVALGVALASAITAVVLYLTNSDDDDDEDDDEESASLTVAPAVGTHGGGVAAHLTF
jgi:tetratricopeptide (TPR) repeat protein